MPRWQATDADRGTVWTAQTNETGSYNLLRLPIGSYGVKVTAPGFQTSVHPPFTLELNQTARVNVQLKVGKVSETVEVTGSAPSFADGRCASRHGDGFEQHYESGPHEPQLHSVDLDVSRRGHH